MLLLTGATGQVGSALLPRLLAEGIEVRCLVRDPRRLGANRVHVQIALGDLADPPSFRNAMRGVDTVVHLAAAIRDQAGSSIEELVAIATWRIVQAAREQGVGHFVFFSTLGASPYSRVRFFRAKALAEQAVQESELPCTVLAPSVIYAPEDRWLTLIERSSTLGVTPISGSGKARFQPIWVEDVIDCAIAAICGPRDNGAGGQPPADIDAERRLRYELAGPETLSYKDIVRAVLAARGRRTAILPLPTPIVSRLLHGLETVLGRRAFATWDEAELLEVPMLSEAGAADVRKLGVEPKRMADVLGS